MTLDTSGEIDGYFLPHHAVFKESSTTTKCRVVFDASAKTTTGVSLNDTLHIGPVVQDDLFTILLRFRKHSIVVSADIQKMYRQISLADQHTKYQRIVWRSSSDKPLQIYKLVTVAYGTASAPYTATRCLRELANIYDGQFGAATHVLRNDCYVDDCLSGCETLEDARKLKEQLIDLLNVGCFQLHKWRSNVPELAEECTSPIVLNKETLNTLGLLWNHVNDSLTYSSSQSPSTKVTKRSILSDIARIFDPLGLLGPIIIVGKILMQSLWKLQVHWDESVPFDIHTRWSQYNQDLVNVRSLSIPRKITNLSELQTIELHGFCDSSMIAYGAAVYIRSVYLNGNVSVHLLCAKSRVAPVKPMTIPRLELCGALLLAELVKRVEGAMKLTFDVKYLWTDSTVVLAWLSSDAAKYKTFVANRISQVQQLTDACIWRHVRTNDNPADLISRGLSCSGLVAASSMWFCGPAYLQGPSSEWPVLKSTVVLVTRQYVYGSG